MTTGCMGLSFASRLYVMSCAGHNPGEGQHAHVAGAGPQERAGRGIGGGADKDAEQPNLVPPNVRA